MQYVARPRDKGCMTRRGQTQKFQFLNVLHIKMLDCVISNPYLRMPVFYRAENFQYTGGLTNDKFDAMLTIENFRVC